MSNVNVTHTDPDVDIELTDFEKDHLIQAYKILKNVVWELFADDAEETQAYMNASSAQCSLAEFLTHDCDMDIKQA